MSVVISREIGILAFSKRYAVQLLTISLVFGSFLSGCATAPSGPDESSAERKRVAFHEISFELPDRGWEQIGHITSSIHFFRRKHAQYHTTNNIGIWPVGVPPVLRSLSPEQHASKYFEGERNLPRYQGRWEGFIEGQREIAGRRYPIMTFRIVFPPAQPVTPVVDGLFLLYFPDDFPERQRFYVFMWQDIRPFGERDGGLVDLDSTVASIRIAPLKQ